MGLRDKIKDAMHGDKDRVDDTTTATHSGQHDSNYNTSNANYDSTKYGQPNTTSDGHNRPYASDTSNYQKEPLGSSTAAAGSGLDTHGHHNKQDSGIDFGGDRQHHRDDGLGRNTNNPNDPYWGDMNQGQGHHGLSGAEGQSSLHRKELPLRPGENQQTSGLGSDRHNLGSSTGGIGNDRHNLGSSTGGIGNDRHNLGSSTGGIGNDRHNIGTSTGIGSDRHNIDTTSAMGNNRQNVGPHDSNIANKMDPRVDSNPSANSPTGGTYNTVAGAGSRDYDSRLQQGSGSQNIPLDSGNTNTRQSHTLNAVGYQNQPSATRGIDQTGGDYDSRIRDRDMGRDRSGLGAAAGAGAAGLAGAGLAGHHNRRDELTRDDLDTGLGGDRQYQAGGGVPQSSMLDPYQSGPGAGNIRSGPHDSNLANKADPRVDSDRDHRGNPTSGIGGNNYGSTGNYGNTGGLGGSNTGYGNAGPHDSNMANKMDPRVDSDLDGRRGGPGMGAGVGAGLAGAGLAGAQQHHRLDNNPNPTSRGSGGLGDGMGPGHFGPGHDGAKVVHTCTSCGHDNDISQYFRKDATYRMG